MLSALASGYFCLVYTDARRPAFMPLWNYASPQGGPNPDYVYSTIEVDSDGVYQISGIRGTTRFVEITQSHENIPNPSLEVPKDPPLRTTNDLDELTIGNDGTFSVILSAERPAGYDGDWWPLDPRAARLLMRKCSCDWNHEIDARVAVNRLDTSGADMTPEEFARRFSNLSAWIEGRILHEIRLVRYYREHHGINVLKRSQWIEAVGGLAKQAYYDGIHEINDGEALIVEVPFPEPCHYWQILVADDRFATVDWVNRQSSLNDVQARVDSDGTFRAVISKRPGCTQLAGQGRLSLGHHPDALLPGERAPRRSGHQSAPKRGARTPSGEHLLSDGRTTSGAAAASGGEGARLPDASGDGQGQDVQARAGDRDPCSTPAGGSRRLRSQ